MTRFRLRQTGLTWRAIDDEVVILDVEKSTYLSVNRAGATLWKTLASSSATRDELAASLRDAFDLSAETSREDVDAFVDTLLEAGLVEEDG